MLDDIFKIHSAVYIEAFPDVTTYNCSTKTKIADFVDVFKCNASLCHNLLVYETFATGITKLFVGI